MRALIQRVSSAEVNIPTENYSKKIQNGLLILLGITHDDTVKDIDWLVNKIVNLRIFNDEEAKMNLSVLDINGEILIISQFTLFASYKKGNRPSYLKSAKPEIAENLYQNFIEKCKLHSVLKIKQGIFGADMKISLVNDGPVTIMLDSKNPE